MRRLEDGRDLHFSWIGVNESHNTIGAKLILVVGILIGVFLLSGPATAQLQVQPVKIELTVQPGRAVRTIVKLENHHPREIKTIDLELVELTQAESGRWQVIDPNSDFDRSKLSSCYDWVRLNRRNVRIRPLRSADVEVTLRVPPGKRGFYFAGIRAMVREQPEATGIVIAVRYLIPIVVETGRTMRQQVELMDVGMEFREPTEKVQGTTLVTMNVENEGGTFPRLTAFAKVNGFFQGYWREITTIEFERVGILPDARLKLKSDVGRSLPAGKYKVAGSLYVDGRRTRPIEKEVDFAGDPAVTTVVTDAPLILDPVEVFIEGLPGATRVGGLRVFNASLDETVNVKAVITTPPVLTQMGIGDLKGTDLSCAEWVKVEPEEFTLRASARQNLRVIANIPNPEVVQANYYALVSFQASFPDGQRAGTTPAYVCVVNKQAEAKPAVYPLKLNLGIIEESKYVIAARFANVGNVHLQPRCKGAIFSPTGSTLREIVLSGSNALMLPLEDRDFSQVVDFSGLNPGIYRLQATLEYASGEISKKQVPIKVTVEGGFRLVEIIRPEEAEKEIGVKW